MAVEIKSPGELNSMRQAGQIVAEILQALQQAVKPGERTSELNEIAERILKSHSSFSPFKGKPNLHPGQPKFPASICVSVNEEIVHGIPRQSRTLRPGDVVSVDVGAAAGGFFGDSAWTFGVEPVSEKARHLMSVTQQALMAGIGKARAGAHLWDVIRAIQHEVDRGGLTLIREYQGHGIGRQLWEEPSIPNFLDEDYRKRPANLLLKPGMTLAIEPMVVTGDWQTKTLADKWTVVTRDGGLAAHFEHTIAITEEGSELLTGPAVLVPPTVGGHELIRSAG